MKGPSDRYMGGKRSGGNETERIRRMTPRTRRRTTIIRASVVSRAALKLSSAAAAAVVALALLATAAAAAGTAAGGSVGAGVIKGTLTAKKVSVSSIDAVRFIQEVGGRDGEG